MSVPTHGHQLPQAIPAQVGHQRRHVHPLGKPGREPGIRSTIGPQDSQAFALSAHGDLKFAVRIQIADNRGASQTPVQLHRKALAELSLSIDHIELAVARRSDDLHHAITIKIRQRGGRINAITCVERKAWAG